MNFDPPSVALGDAILHFIREGTGDFADLLLALHAEQRRICAPYEAYCESFPAPTSWREIPPLPLSAFRHAAISCFPPEKALRTFRTSGTTGEGFGEHHFATLDFYHAAALTGWTQAGLPTESIFSLVPNPAEARHSSLSCMAGWLTDPSAFYWQQWAKLAEVLSARTEPCVLFGTALGFLDFFEHLGTRSLSLPTGSISVETGGYKGTRRSLPKEDLYALFTAKLGLDSDDVWNEYGMTELSSQFYTRGLDRPHAGAPWIRALVIDPGTSQEVADGETGVLHIFDLANVDSCCALQTRDLAVRNGDDFILLGRDPAALPRGCSRTADEMLAS